MNIVVTRNEIQYSGFLKVCTLKEVSETIGNIEFLVYHESKESSQDKVFYLEKIKDRLGTFIYICDSRKVDDVIKLLVPGLNGKYFDDEFFLSSEDELFNLVDSIDEITEIAELGGVSVVSDFLKRYLKDGSSSFDSSSKNYLIAVKEAVKLMSEEFDRKNYELIQMSETTTELFSSTAATIAQSSREIAVLKGELSKISEIVKQREIERASVESAGVGRGPNISFFPQVSYMKDKRIIRIKEFGRVSYLTSFVLGLRGYLETIKNVRPKLIVVMPKGALLEAMYKDFNWVTQSTVNDKRNFYNSIVFTNHPSSEVISALLNDSDYDTFIVLDRSVYAQNHILNSRGKVFYAVGSPRFLGNFKLPIKDCFSSVDENESLLFNIKYDSKYPKEKMSRDRYYIKNYENAYELLI